MVVAKEYKEAGNGGGRLPFRLTTPTIGSTDRSASEVIRLLAAMSESFWACLGIIGDREFAMRSVMLVRLSWKVAKNRPVAGLILGSRI